MPSSLAMTSAILFSIPSSLSFENGRLFGSPQTRSSLAPSAGALRDTKSAGTTTSHAARMGPFVINSPESSFELEDVDHAALGRILVEAVLVCEPDRAECGVRIIGREVLRDRHSEPAADAGVD